VSLPFTDFCEPLASTHEDFALLFEQALDHGRNCRWKSLELRGASDFLESNPASSQYFLHMLDLVPDNQQPHGKNGNGPCTVADQTGVSSSLFSSFRENTRRNIRKAQQKGIRIEILTTEKAVREFYRLNQLTRRDHGLPPQPYRFFERIHEHVISQGKGFVALALLDNQAIAGSVYFHFGTSAVYKYGASDKRYQGVRPNNLVMWEAIAWLAQRGYSSLSFGRTDLDHDGLRRFKLGWAASEETESYYKYDIKAGRFLSNIRTAVNSASARVFSAAPLPVLRAVGSLLYRHMG
jgi:lipid II:glycine glycyltransferase (peptidoglycan interpeptide bridge formation enzyme)